MASKINPPITLDDTLLMYSESEAKYRIPDQISGQPIRKIGMGAFHGLDTLNEISMGKNITEISSHAFSRCSFLQKVQMTGAVKKICSNAFLMCHALKEIHIDALRLSRSSWVSFQCACSEGPVGIPVSATPPEHPLVSQLTTVLAVKPAYLLPPKLPYLYHEPAQQPINLPAIRDKRKVMGFTTAGYPLSEEMAVQSLIEGDYPVWKDNKAENHSDRLLRLNFDRPVETCLLFTADFVSNGPHDTVFVNLHVWFGRFFWPSFTSLVHENKTYYIYHRVYAASVPDPGYYRRDIAVFDKHGIIEDEELSRRIYAKYALPSIL